MSQDRQSGRSCPRPPPVDRSEYCTMWFRNGFGKDPDPALPGKQMLGFNLKTLYVHQVHACMSVACVDCIIYLSLIKVVLCNTPMIDLPPHPTSHLKSKSSLSVSRSLSRSHTHARTKTCIRAEASVAML